MRNGKIASNAEYRMDEEYYKIDDFLSQLHFPN